jgi:hypothetical protein
MHNGPIRHFTVWGVPMARKFKPGYDFRSSESLRQRDGQRTHSTATHDVPSGTTEGQRPCARGKWCASAKTTEQPDGTKERIPGHTYQVFCPACTDLIVTALTELPGAYTRIEEEYGSPVRRGDQAIRTPFGPSVPIRLDIDALQREAPPVIGGWAARVRSVPGLQLSDPEHGDPATPDGFTEACRVLRLHVTPLLSLQPKWMTRTYRLPLDEETEALIGDEEILRAGDDYVTVQVPCDGATAGNEILGLKWRSTAVLGELKPKPETFDGIPCRECETISLERAEPPPDPDSVAMMSRCSACGDKMSEEEFHDHSVRYKQWAESAGVPACRRCQREDHGECQWSACPCRNGGHRLAA